MSQHTSDLSPDLSIVRSAEDLPKLTERQQRVLDVIERRTAMMGYPPTIREIGESLGIRSTNGVNDHLKALQRKGYIHRTGNKSRSFRVLFNSRGEPTGENERNTHLQLDPMAGQADDDLLTIPVLGRVAAGVPILAVENAEDTVRVSSFFFSGARRGKVFALRVVGQSMIEDGILDGDFIFIRKQSTANPGDIVVAMIEGEATVKRYYPEGDRIRFQPANHTMEPIFVHKSEFRETSILGIVVGVYRQL